MTTKKLAEELKVDKAIAYAFLRYLEARGLLVIGRVGRREKGYALRGDLNAALGKIRADVALLVDEEQSVVDAAVNDFVGKVINGGQTEPAAATGTSDIEAW